MFNNVSFTLEYLFQYDFAILPCNVCVFLAGSLLLHLLDWVRLHKADVDEKARDVLQSESPAEHRDYWDVVCAAYVYI